MPDALKLSMGAKPGIPLKDTRNGTNMSRQLNQSRNPVFIEPTTKADIRPDNNAASLNCATMLHSRWTNVGSGGITGHPVKASVTGSNGSFAAVARSRKQSFGQTFAPTTADRHVAAVRLADRQRRLMPNCCL